MTKNGREEQHSTPANDNSLPGGIQETAANVGNKLKEVTQEVDKRTGVSNALDQAGSKAKEVQHHVQDGVNEHIAKPAAEAGSGISETARNTTGAVNEHVVEPAVHNFQGAWSATQQQLQRLDEQHHITSTATSALESGKDFLSKTLGGHSDQQTPAESSTQEKTNFEQRHSR